MEQDVESAVDVQSRLEAVVDVELHLIHENFSVFDDETLVYSMQLFVNVSVVVLFYEWIENELLKDVQSHDENYSMLLVLLIDISDEIVRLECSNEEKWNSDQEKENSTRIRNFGLQNVFVYCHHRANGNMTVVAVPNFDSVEKLKILGLLGLGVLDRSQMH